MVDIITSSKSISPDEIHQKEILKSKMHDRKCYSNPKLISEIMEISSSLPNSPSKENITSINMSTSNSKSNSLSNMTSEIYKETDVINQNCNENGESVSSRSQSSFVNTNLKPKKLSSASISSSYHIKLASFRKTFVGSDVVSDLLLSDYSCALAKSSHKMLVQGRLYITEHWITFYSKIMSFENKIVLPISGISSISKEKTAKVIPNAIRIYTKSGKYFFTSFVSRDKVYNMINDLWESHKKKEKISIDLKKVIIMDCYGFVQDDALDYLLSNEKKSNSKTEEDSSQQQDDMMLNEHEPTNFILGVESEIDSEVSQISTTKVIHSNECRSTFSPQKTIKRRKRTNQCEQDLSSDENNNVNNVGKDNLKRHGSMKSYNFCDNHEHSGKFYLDIEVEMHVDKLFNCLFTNSHFTHKFMDHRKTHNIVYSHWADCDGKDGKTRKLTYTLTLKAKIGPKVSPSEERQYLHGTSLPGLFYLVDTSVFNSGFPLADSFHAENRYCLINISPFKSRLRVCSQIVYDKQLFFASKSLVESTSKSGMAEYFADLGNSLKIESRNCQMNTNYHHNTDMHGVTVSNLYRSSTNEITRSISGDSTALNLTLDTSETDNLISKHHYHNHYPKDGRLTVPSRTFFRAERAWLILIVLTLFICLCLSFLYSRFRQLEEMTNRQIHIEQQQQQHHEFTSNMNNAKVNWKQLFLKQQQNQIDDLSQWKSIVETSIDLLDEMKKLLVVVKSNLDEVEKEVKTVNAV